MTVAPKIILITDPSYSVDHTARVIEIAARALGPGELLVQLRDKTGLPADVKLTAVRLRQVTRDAGALLSVNAIRPSPDAMLDIADHVGADGVHVACDPASIAGARAAAKWISVPSHADADAARLARVDAMLVSPIFTTPGKGPPRGVSALRSARASGCFVYALGGVTPLTAQMCAEAGAHGVAVIRALLGADDPAAVALELAKPFAPPAEDV